MKQKLLLLLACSGLYYQSNAQVNLGIGLVAQYDFTAGSTFDVSGNSLNLINNGATATTDRFGNAGDAYSYNGFGNYMNAAYDPILDPGPAMSVSLWVNLNTSTSNQKIIGKTSVAFDGGYLVGVQNNQVQLEVWDQGPTHWTLNGGSISASQWTHIVYTYETVDSMKLYINGVFVDKTLVGDWVGSNTQDLIVGSAPWDPANFFNTDGAIDDIRIYSRAINSAEVAALYNLTVTEAKQMTKKPEPSLISLNQNGLYSAVNFTGKEQIRVFGTDGRVVLDRNIAGANLLDITSTPAGIYLVQILNSDGEIRTIKLAK